MVSSSGHHIYNEEQEDILLREDEELVQLLTELHARIPDLDRTAQIRVKAWIFKIAAETRNLAWKKNRKLHAKMLLQQLRTGTLEPPFCSLPPHGPLQTMPKWLTYRYLYPPFPARFETKYKRPYRAGRDSAPLPYSSCTTPSFKERDFGRPKQKHLPPEGFSRHHHRPLHRRYEGGADKELSTKLEFAKEEARNLEWKVQLCESVAAEKEEEMLYLRNNTWKACVDIKEYVKECLHDLIDKCEAGLVEYDGRSYSPRREPLRQTSSKFRKDTEGNSDFKRFYQSLQRPRQGHLETETHAMDSDHENPWNSPEYPKFSTKLHWPNSTGSSQHCRDVTEQFWSPPTERQNVEHVEVRRKKLGTDIELNRLASDFANVLEARSRHDNDEHLKTKRSLESRHESPTDRQTSLHRHLPSPSIPLQSLSSTHHDNLHSPMTGLLDVEKQARANSQQLMSNDDSLKGLIEEFTQELQALKEYIKQAEKQSSSGENVDSLIDTATLSLTQLERGLSRAYMLCTSRRGLHVPGTMMQPTYFEQNEQTFQQIGHEIDAIRKQLIDLQKQSLGQSLQQGGHQIFQPAFITGKLGNFDKANAREVQTAGTKSKEKADNSNVLQSRLDERNDFDTKLMGDGVLSKLPDLARPKHVTRLNNRHESSSGTLRNVLLTRGMQQSTRLGNAKDLISSLSAQLKDHASRIEKMKHGSTLKKIEKKL